MAMKKTAPKKSNIPDLDQADRALSQALKSMNAQSPSGSSRANTARGRVMKAIDSYLSSPQNKKYSAPKSKMTSTAKVVKKK
jgi:hypothetical protein